VLHDIEYILNFLLEEQPVHRRLSIPLAGEHNLKSLAFCCISTGEYRFPNQLAAETAVRTVRDYLDKTPDSSIEAVVFNVFKDIDYSFYSKILECSQE